MAKQRFTKQYWIMIATNAVITPFVMDGVRRFVGRELGWWLDFCVAFASGAIVFGAFYLFGNKLVQGTKEKDD